jgi:hypothetical protein
MKSDSLSVSPTIEGGKFPLLSPLKVVIEVYMGVATCTICPRGVEVEIIDHDIQEE